MDPSALTSLQQLTSLSAELTQLQLEEMTFHLMSAEDGVSVTRWRVRVVSPEADVEICFKYDATKDEVRLRWCYAVITPVYLSSSRQMEEIKTFTAFCTS